MKMIRLLWIGVALFGLAVSGCGGGQVTPEPTPEDTEKDLESQKNLQQ